MYDTSNSNLWEQFQFDFKDFIIDSLKNATLRSIQSLRGCLLSRGLYVAKNDKRKTITQALYECLTKVDQHRWTDDEIIQAVDRLEGPFLSSKLNNCLKNLNATKSISDRATEIKPKIENENCDFIPQSIVKVCHGTVRD